MKEQTLNKNGRQQRVSTAPRRLRMEADLVGGPIRSVLSRRKRAWLQRSVKELVLAGVAYQRAIGLCTWSLDRYGNIDTDWLLRGE